MGILDRNYKSYWCHKGYEENGKIMEFFTMEGKKLFYEIAYCSHSWIIKVFSKTHGYLIQGLESYQEATKVVEDLEIASKNKSLKPMIRILSMIYKVNPLSNSDSYSLKECRFV